MSNLLQEIRLFHMWRWIVRKSDWRARGWIAGGDIEHDPPIDAVITWVDGNDPAHIAKREQFLIGSRDEAVSEATLPKRWVGANELAICVRSLERNAPWIRTVWIVTDDQTPDLSYCSDTVQKKIRIVSHHHIFRQFGDYLPTFNSICIESMMWRIEGLAERFIYFNDDFFLLNPIKKGDFFKGDKTVLRGRWKKLSKRCGEDFLKLNFYRNHKVNAGRMVEFDVNNFFSLAHVASPMRKSVLADYFRDHPMRLVDNIRHRFRVQDQFHPPSLFSNIEIVKGRALFVRRRDWFNFSSRFCTRRQYLTPMVLLLILKFARFRILCINDLNVIEARSKRFRRVLEWAITT